MSRQYKGMQEELLSKVNALEAKILELKDELERSTIAIDELRKEKAQELALKDAEIADQKQKMEVRAPQPAPTSRAARPASLAPPPPTACAARGRRAGPP